MLIYKIFRADEWAVLETAGETDGAPIDVADGYIHFSTAETVAKTAAMYFDGAADLVLVAVQSKGLAPVKWEEARGGQLFPHLYRKMVLDDVVWHKSLPLIDGTHQFPDLT